MPDHTRRLPWEPFSRLLLRVTDCKDWKTRNDVYHQDMLGVKRAAELCDVHPRQIHRWRDGQGIRLHTADRMVCRLGYHPIEVWGDEYLTIGEGQ